MEANPLESYLARFQPLKLLPRGPVLTEEEAIRWLVDEMYRASRLMVKTHLKDDIIRFIVLAQVLDTHGYVVAWAKGKRCIAATKKLGGDVPLVSGASKEVGRYANRTNNASAVASGN